MVKFLAALIAVIVLAVGGFFGLEHYIQQRVQDEVDTTFAALRAAGAKASHGKISFDLWSRTLTAADISVESAQPPVQVKVARLVGAGVGLPEAGRLAAERIDISDLDVRGTTAGQTGAAYQYKAPRIEVVKYAGPSAALRRLDPAAPLDVYRFGLEHFAAVTAAAITIPSVTATMNPTAASTAAYGYAGLALREVGGGKVASISIDRIAVDLAIAAAGKRETVAAAVDKVAAHDFDTSAAIAILDPAGSKDDKVVRIYRQMTAGAYTATFGSGMRLRLEGASADEIGVRPAKLQLAALLGMMDATPPPGTTPTPAQMRDLFENVASLYEGAYAGAVELRGLSIETPQGPFRLAALRLGKLDNGKLDELAVEGLDARAPQGPVKLGRFALKSLDVARLMRVAAQMPAAGRAPAPDQLALLIPLLEGTEIQGLVAPYKETGRPVSVETLSLSWGQFVGPIPTRARTTLKISGPIDAMEVELRRALSAAGLTSISFNADIGAAWAEATSSFALEPATLEIGNVLTASARLSLAGVARGIFSPNPMQVMMQAAQVEAGPLELTLRDNGGVDLLVAQHARQQNLSRDAARRAILESIRAAGMQMANGNPDAMAIAGAIARFIEVPRGTMTIKLTPRGKVPLMALIDTMRNNPLGALGRFQIDASVGR